MRKVIDMIKKYWNDDDSFDLAQQSGSPTVTEPEDFSKMEEPTVNPPTLDPVGTIKSISLEDLSEEDLLKELNRRKTRKIDQEIASLKDRLLALETERNAILGLPAPQKITTPSITKEAALKPSIKQESKPLNSRGCTCEDGCYKCIRAY